MGLMTSRDSRNTRLYISIGTYIDRDTPSFVGFIRWIHSLDLDLDLDSDGRARTTERRRNDDGTTERDAVPIYVADDDRGTTDATGGRRTGTGRATERRETTVDDARS